MNRLTNTFFRKTGSLFVLLFLFFTITVFSQSDSDTTKKKVSIIVNDPEQDSTLNEYSAIEEETKKPAIEYFDKKDIYRDSKDSLTKRVLPDSVLKKMLQDDAFWYANYAFEKEKEQKENQQTPLSERTWFKTLMWIVIIGGFAIALMLFLSDSNVSFFRKSAKAFSEEEQLTETDNIFEINYRERIDKAVKAGNYRLAVRLMFLQMLKTMAGKNMIQYKQDRTNFDYLMQLRSTVHYNDFFRIARNYEYTWYGNFPVTEEAWQIIKNDFEKLNSSLSRK